MPSSEQNPVASRFKQSRPSNRPVYHGQLSPAFAQQCLPRNSDGLQWRHCATDERAVLRCEAGAQRGSGKVRPQGLVGLQSYLP
jgi:hypothetical protein